MKILFIDDDLLFSEIAIHALEKNGYDVSGAADGPEALELFEKQNFDVVVCDRVLPEMSGDEICAEIHTRQPDLPIILISGGSGAGYDKTVFSSFCRKPFLLRTLTDAIEAAYRSRAPQAA